jgi:hypothetical protein
MKLKSNNLLITIVGAALLALPLLVAMHWQGASEIGSRTPNVGGLLASNDPFDRVVCEVTLRGLAQQAAAAGCLDYGDVALCLHPDTKPEDVEEILRQLPSYAPGAGMLGYNKRGRWSYTCTDGNTGVNGDPITITWGFVPDGTWADGGSSNLFAVFDSAWGSSGWMNKMRNSFERWGDVIGITYVEVSDDGANMPGSPGALGVRGDVRIGGRSIDGPSNVLAYNYYPNGGDMVLDTDDVGYYRNPINNYGNLKNVVCHEHGHGIGLGHVIPEDRTKLMEAIACPSSAFIGPQDDDIRGGMRSYGDVCENNDTNATPTDLGTLSDTLVVENLSIDGGDSDVDWYLITLTGTSITIEVDPYGWGYMCGNEGGSASWVCTDSISDPDIELYCSAGTTLLASATSGGMQETEVLMHTVPSPGSYQFKVFRKAGTGNNVQRYTLTVYEDDQSGVEIAGDDISGSGLKLSIQPNPFTSRATARFYTASSGPYVVEVFDVTGRLTRSIEGYAAGGGWAEVVWDGRDDRGNRVAAGLYFVRTSFGRRSEIGRALLIR